MTPLLVLLGDFMETFWVCVAGATGLVIGSFLNVVIWRLPRGQNLAKPPSACPGCDAPIRWYDNIPVISWLLLRARCRGCKMPISWRYPLVELITGFLFVLVAVQFPGDAPTIVVTALTCAALVAISFIDLDLRIIPDKISKPGIAFGVLSAPFTAHFALRQPEGWLLPDVPWLDACLFMLAGAVAGAGIIYVIRAIGSAILKKEAMGLGDAKLLAMLGAFVGPMQALYTLVLGCVGGAVIGLIWFAIGKRRAMGAEVRVRGASSDLEAEFDRVKIREDLAYLRGAPAAEADQRVHLDMVLPAERILEDENAAVSIKGTLISVTPAGDTYNWVIRGDPPKSSKAAQLTAERIGMFALSYKYIPFGPFLALGGLALLLYGSHVEWFLRVGYPDFVRGVMGG